MMARASGAALLYRRNNIEAVAFAEPHIDDRKCGGSFFNFEKTLADRFSGRHRKAPVLHGAGEALQERPIILDDQKRSLGRKRADCSIGHDISNPYNYLPESGYGS
jgi:hypothetical protein